MKRIHNKSSQTATQLANLHEDLSFEAKQSWTASLCYMARYFDEHSYNDSGLCHKRSAMIAAARLDWLLQESRVTLNNVFTEKEIFILLNCYDVTIFSPDQIQRMASNVCNELGIDVCHHKEHIASPLIEKLIGLNALQQLTLADALERVWYRSVETWRISEVFRSIGIKLA